MVRLLERFQRCACVRRQTLERGVSPGAPAPRGLCGCLETSLSSLWGAPGIEWAGSGMQLHTPQCPGRPPPENGWAMAAVLGGSGVRARPLYEWPRSVPAWEPLSCEMYTLFWSHRVHLRSPGGLRPPTWLLGTSSGPGRAFSVSELPRGPRCPPGVDTGPWGQSSGCLALKQSTS